MGLLDLILRYPHLRSLRTAKVSRGFGTAGLCLGMTIDFPDGTLRRLQDPCRDKLDQAYRRYSKDRTAETRAAYLNALKIFADLVVRHPPPDSE